MTVGVKTTRELDSSSGQQGFRPYPAYSDSGVEWLGGIPAHWEVRPLKYYLRAPLAYGVLKPDKYEGDDGVPFRILAHLIQPVWNLS